MTEIPYARSIAEVPVNLTVPLLAGDVVHVNWTGATTSSPCGPFYYAVQVSTNGGDSGPQLEFASGASPQSTFITITRAATELHIIPFTDSWCSGGTLHGVSFTVDQVGFCQYGVQPKLGTAVAINLSSEVLTATLATVGMPWLYSWLAGFLFQNFLSQNICAGQRPVMPVITDQSATWSQEQWLQVLMVVLWAQYCECSPGTPNPVPPPSITQPQPPGLPAPPTFNCSNVDPCAALIAIQQLLAKMHPMLAADLELDTLQQRYKLPFATIPGARHTSLTGEGSFAIDRLVGVSAVLEGFDAQPPVLEGNPPYVMNLGWISASDGDGMLQEKRFTQQAMTWFPDKMAMATLLGYSFRPGIVATITELKIEP